MSSRFAGRVTTVERAEKNLNQANEAGSKDEITKAQKELKQAKQALDAVRASAQSCPRITYAITISLLPPEPDPENAYIANLSHSPLRDDNFKIETTPEGLLTTMEITAADRTPGIIIDLATAIASVAVPAPAAVTLHKLGERIPPCPGEITFENIFDPAEIPDETVVDPGRIPDPRNEKKPEKQRLNEKLIGANIPFAIDWEIPDIYKKQFNTKGVENPVNGLLYRRPLPYVISVSRCDPSCSVENSKKIPEQASVVFLPNRGPIGYVPLSASAAVTMEDNIAFKQGLLTKWDTSQPSELASIVRIPAEVVKKSLSAVADIIQLRFNITRQETESVKAQKALLEGLEEFKKAREAQAQPVATTP